MSRYLEDFHAGQTFESPAHTISHDEIVAFAIQYDPQPFHLDEEAAKSMFFGRLIASGWQTAALTMRMLTEAQLDIEGGIVGAGMDELRWPSPLVPGDTIHVRVDILETTPSRSKPERGMMRTCVETVRTDGTAVQRMVATLVVPRRRPPVPA